jgi:uncharacterized phage-associated protein
MSFRFHFDADKAIQAIGVLMTHDHVSQMNFMRVLKLLYLAEREVLRETGRPIIGDSVIATERGPVMENLHSLLHGQHSNFKSFSEHFNTVRYNLVMHLQPDIGELSEYEIDMIRRIASQHEDEDEWELVQFTRDHLPEWQKNNPGNSSKAISVEDILVAIGKNDAEIKQIIADEMRRRGAATLRDIVRESRQVPA